MGVASPVAVVALADCCKAQQASRPKTIRLSLDLGALAVNRKARQELREAILPSQVRLLLAAAAVPETHRLVPMVDRAGRTVSGMSVPTALARRAKVTTLAVMGAAAAAARADPEEPVRVGRAAPAHHPL